MRKIDVQSAVTWADSHVSESQCSVQENYWVLTPLDWRKPDEKVQVRIHPEGAGLPHPRIQRLRLVAFGACCKLFSDVDYMLLISTRIRYAMYVEKVSTQHDLVSLIFREVKADEKRKGKKRGKPGMAG